jgi:hypothetical protein
LSIYAGFDQEQFERWVFDIDDKLESFRESVLALRERLDGSVASLDAVGEWLVNTYKTPEAVDALHRAITVDGFVRYIGEVHRKSLGGHWDMAFDGLPEEQPGPYLVGFDGAGTKLAPYALMKECLATRSTDLKRHLRSERA